MYKLVVRVLCCSLALGLFTEQLLAQSDWRSPPIEDCISVRIGTTGEAIHLERMLADLTSADVVFLGETHNDDTTHRVEWTIYEELMSRRKSKVVLAMEMFERDVQPHLNDYLAGTIDEKAFLSLARPWQNYHEAYRPMIELAKSSGGPVVASNFPRSLRMRMTGDFAIALDGLGNDRKLAPAEFLPNSDLYWKRTDNAIRGHAGMMPAPSESDRLYSTQSLWDNSMGESCALALDKHPGYSVVHVNGGFHTSYWDGTAAQLKKRKPDAKIKTVSIVPATSPSSARQLGAPVADYVVIAEQRATNLNEGRWSVNVSRESKYQFHLPAGASAEHPVPLLIWIGDDGQSSDEGLQYWRSAFGQHAAIVVLDPPYRELQRDLSSGGRWFWSDNFSGDVSAMAGAIERTWSYVLERYPIDSNRVCLAGEGTGATVVAAATLLTERMNLNSVAIRPRQYMKLKDYPLPLLEDWGSQKPPKRTLQVIADPSDGDWWRKELQAYESVGLNSKWTDVAVDPWLNFAQTENAIRTALNVSSSPTVEIISRRFIHVDSKSPLHLIWSRLAAQRTSTDGVLCVAVTNPPGSDEDATPVSVNVTPDALAKPNSIPKCPGPFGGTTVLVVGGGADEAELARWIELETNDPLNKQSRFHRVRVATTGDGERSLQKILAALVEQKRTNVLIVPAQFYARESLMRELENQAADQADRMTIQWLPGLGGQPLSISDR